MSHTKETRRESYKQLDRETINKRILSVLDDGCNFTAREIAQVLYKRGYLPYPVRQLVAPRLTEMVAAGLVEVTGKVRDHVTLRKVVTYRRVR